MSFSSFLSIFSQVYQEDFLFLREKELPVHKYAVCTLSPAPALDTFTLTEPSAPVSVFCQSAKLEGRVRFSYRKTLQKRSAYKPPLAFMIFFSLSGWYIHCQHLQFFFFTLGNEITIWVLFAFIIVTVEYYNCCLTSISSIVRYYIQSILRSLFGHPQPQSLVFAVILSDTLPPSCTHLTQFDWISPLVTPLTWLRFASEPHADTHMRAHTQTHTAQGVKWWQSSGPVMTRPSC